MPARMIAIIEQVFFCQLEGCGLRYKFLCVMIASILFCGNSGPAKALSAKAAALIDADSGEVLLVHNADERLPMASTTKIMTAFTAIEMGELDREIEVKPEYTRVEGSSMYLKPGEKLPLREVLYGLMLMSGNDAALCIAGECGGQTSFVERMNDKAQALGLENTHFDNPNGLDGETHHTTALELAQLTSYALKDSTFREIVSTKIYHSDQRSMKNHNKMLWLYDGAIGVKTGFTKKSGRCLVSAAEKEGRILVAVTLNDPDDWRDHEALLNEGFSHYQQREFHQAGEKILEIPVVSGRKTIVPVVTRQSGKGFLSETEWRELKTKMIGAEFTYAPIHAGQRYGKIQYICGNRIVFEDDLIFGESVEMDLTQEKPDFWAGVIQQIRSFFSF